MSLYAKYSDLGDKTPKMDQNMMDALVQSITTREQKQSLIGGNRVCVIDVHADWCGPCKQIAPMYVELAKKYSRPGVCVLAKENIELELSQNIRGVPTFLFFKDGQYVDVVTGADMTGDEGVEKKLLALLTN